MSEEPELKIVGIVVKPEFLEEIKKNTVLASNMTFPCGIPVYVNNDIPYNYTFVFQPKKENNGTLSDWAKEFLQREDIQEMLRNIWKPQPFRPIA